MLFGLIHNVPGERMTRDPVVYWQKAPIRAYCTECARTRLDQVERIENNDSCAPRCDACGGEFRHELVRYTVTIETFPCRIF